MANCVPDVLCVGGKVVPEGTDGFDKVEAAGVPCEGASACPVFEGGGGGTSDVVPGCAAGESAADESVCDTRAASRALMCAK